MKKSPVLAIVLSLSLVAIFGACSKSKTVNQANHDDVVFNFKPGIGNSGGQALNAANNGQAPAANPAAKPVKPNHEETIRNNPQKLSDELIERKIDLYSDLLNGAIKRTAMNQLIQDIHYELRNNIHKKDPVPSLSKTEQAQEIIEAFKYFPAKVLQGIPYIHSLKIQIEENLSKMHGEDSLYRISATSQWDWLMDNRMQCSSGSKMLQNAWIRTNIANYSAANPVMIHTPGHIQLGYISAENNRFYLYAVEATTSGISQEPLGPTDELYKIEEAEQTQFRIVDADYFMLATIFQFDMTEKEALWFRDTLTEDTAKEFNIVYSEKVLAEVKPLNKEKANRSKNKSTKVAQNFVWPPAKKILNTSIFSIPGDLSDIKDEDMDRPQMDRRRPSPAITDPGPQEISDDIDTKDLLKQIEEEKEELKRQQLEKQRQQQLKKNDVPGIQMKAQDFSKISADFFNFKESNPSDYFGSPDAPESKYRVNIDIKYVSYRGMRDSFIFNHPEREEMNENAMADHFNNRFHYIAADIGLLIKITHNKKTYTTEEEFNVNIPHTRSFYNYLSVTGAFPKHVLKFGAGQFARAIWKGSTVLYDFTKEGKVPALRSKFDAGYMVMGNSHPAIFLTLIDLKEVKEDNSIRAQRLGFLLKRDFFKVVLKTMLQKDNKGKNIRNFGVVEKFTNDVENTKVLLD